MNGKHRDESDKETQKLKGDSQAPTSNSILASRNNSFSITGEDVVEKTVVSKKLYWHIMSRLCLLTVLNNLDRANLAYAAPQMNELLGFSDETYGNGSSVFFLGYMLLQLPCQALAARVNLSRFLGILLVLWGIVATAFVGLTSSHVHLYILRFLLGATEAGTFPVMWAYLTKYYAGGPELTAAWGFVGAAQPLAQVLGGPLASLLLWADGFLGLHGYQWLFLMEGLPTILLGIWIWNTLAPTPEVAQFLTPTEREHVIRTVKTNKEELKKKTGEQDFKYVLKCWKVYAQGLGSGTAGILRFGAMYWTPLICYSIVYGTPDPDPDSKSSVWKVSMSALLASIPFTWAALCTYFNSKWSKERDSMYWHCLIPISVGSIALVILALTLDHHPYWALFGLTLSATSQASNPVEWGYPSTYLHGEALNMGWALANCISGFGGFVGPMLIGQLKNSFGTFVMPMSILAIVNTCAVVYFAILLKYLPVKTIPEVMPSLEEEEDDEDLEAQLCAAVPQSDRSHMSDQSQRSDV